MRWLLAMLLSGSWLLGCEDARKAAPAADPTPPTPSARVSAPLRRLQGGLRPQPKPGERVRQPELDGYCGETERAGAFYYHGGSPVVRLAREHGCAPLYLSECEEQGKCYPPRDQEPGMWCCSSADEQQAAVRAKR